MLGIYACEPLMKDSVKIVSSSIRGNLQLEKSKKDLVWKLIEECSNLAPDCTIIAIGPKGFVDYVRENDGLYYRFFAHRIIVKPMSEDNIIESMYRGIRSEHLVPTKSFNVY